MKIAIIGAGHIGSAIVTCLAQGHLYNEKDIIVSNPNIDKLERLQEHFPAIHITTDNQQAISEAEVIVLAINPWKVDEVLSPLRFSRTQILVSLVSGVCISHLAHLTEAEMPIFRAVPNMAITERSSLTLIASRGTDKEYQQLIKQIFEEGGKCLFLQEKQLDTTSALTSSGIAFALKYMQAVMQAGIELGIPGKDAMQMAAYSMEGATELILNHNTHPLLEIEKVTTPGGTTIKGLNELEHKGFTSSIIQAIKSRSHLIDGIRKFFGETFGKSSCKNSDITGTFTKRRKMHLKNRKTIKQVLTEMPGFDLLLQIPVGSSNDTHIDSCRLGITDLYIFSCFKDTQ